MIRALSTKSVTACAGVVVALLFLTLALPAYAADPVFPTGSRVGLVPPPGMVMSKRFMGFEDADNDAAIIINLLPDGAYAQMEQTATPEVLKQQGIAMEKRDPIELKNGKAFVVTGSSTTADKPVYRKWIMVANIDDVTTLINVQIPATATAYTDAIVRAALGTVTVRPTVPDAERLSLLPFSVGDLAGFQIEAVLPGRAVVLSDVSTDANSGAGNLKARMLIAAEEGGPGDTEDHGNFARNTFDGIGGIKDVQLTMSEPLNINGQQGYQTMAQAKQAQSDVDLMVVQWLRFGTTGFLQMVGIARADLWTSALTRMRTVRDSIDQR